MFVNLYGVKLTRLGVRLWLKLQIGLSKGTLFIINKL